jgi:hypothetical protein
METSLRKVFASKLSIKSKLRLLALARKFALRNIIFVLTLGAVKNDYVQPKEMQFHALSPKSALKLSIIRTAINEANKKLLWPVRFKLRFIDGMSGQSFRLVLNNLLNSCDSYLEIGTWKGSTACTALDGNEISAWLVDDWSEFGGPASDAIRNISSFLGISTRLTIVSQDFNKVDYKNLIDQPIDIYLFDGPHAQQDHENGAEIINQLQFETLVYIVDDWNWEDVRKGTLSGLELLDAKVVYKLEIFPGSKKRFQYSRWHNGYCFFILEKSKDL